MPAAEAVRPEKWRNMSVLFDNGWYSVVSGTYDNGDVSVLGERWNGEQESLGFPNVAGNPVWHVIPEFLAIPILHGLLDEITTRPTAGAEQFVENIVRELRIQYRQHRK